MAAHHTPRTPLVSGRAYTVTYRTPARAGIMEATYLGWQHSSVGKHIFRPADGAPVLYLREEEFTAEGPKRNTDTDTRAMGDRVMAAAVAILGRRSARDRDRLSAAFEHGQWWVTDDRTGTQWAVVDAVGGRSVDGFDLEQVTQGEAD